MPEPRTHHSPTPAAAAAPLAELAQTWLTAKRAMESSEQATKGHSDRARHADLARWGQLLTSTSTSISTSADHGLRVSMRKSGEIDIVVANAGLEIIDQAISDAAVGQFERLLAGNS